MEPEVGSFTQLQLSRRSRSKSSIWRAKDVEAASISPSSRRSTVRDSVMSVADMWAQGRSRDSIDSRASVERNNSQTSLSRKGEELRRWDGTKRATTPWDEIRRDPELWFPDGDCFIHFYGRGSSRRGPSLRLHRDDLENAGCMHMLSKFADNALLEEDEDEEFSPIEEDGGQDGGFRSNPNTRGKDELFIPAPPLLNRDEALKFHVTTRNFFACLYAKPIVGQHLGESLVLVHERLNMYRPDKERNRDDMLEYCDDQGYTDFRDCPDHAMAMMYYAEKLRETDLWTEAFVHSVGMYDILNTAIEFPTVSRGIGALITRAHLEMTLRLEHAYADLGGFMEDSIASAFPKLPEPALKHLERFRGFLQSFYVQQHGYWPPPSLLPGADFSVVTKSLLRSMYTDLRYLYLFLRDPKSDPKPTQAQLETYKAIYGGLVTPQLIAAFDKRFKHSSLPNPLPLLPSGAPGGKSPSAGSTHNLSALDVAASAKPSSGSAFARFLRPSKRKSQKALNVLNLLSAATNTNDPDVMDCLLVQEYSRFERDYTVRGEEKFDPVEGRKVRWLLIYALLQTVIGVIAIPREVSGVEKVEYPLCVQTGGTPPWRKRTKVKAVMDGAATPILDALSTASSPSASPYLTPRSSSAMSGAVSPISAADYIPPVPQLVLSELNRLNGSRGSFDSSRNGSRSPAPPGSSADSIRSSGTARPGKPKLKSSSASIRSTGSTRSSFSAMLNRSLYIAPSMTTMDAHTPRESDRPPPSKPKERPTVQKQKTAPPAVHTAENGTGKKLRKKEPTSMFGWSRSASRQASRQASPVRKPTTGRETPIDRSAAVSPAPTSPAQSTFSNGRSSVRFEPLNHEENTPATSEFPQSARLGQAPSMFKPQDHSDVQSSARPREVPQERYQPSPQPQSRELPQTVQRSTPRLAPLSTIGASEPERGRSTHAPYSPAVASPDAPTPTKKVRNFSRGRSMERPSPVVSPVNPEAPPPIPTASKPSSRATSPAPEPERRAYTDAGMPPQLPNLTKPHSRATSQVRSPEPYADEFYDARSPQSPAPPPMPMYSKPRSRAQSMNNSPEREPGDELPPPLPVYSKPNSRSQSPAPPTPKAAYSNPYAPPPMPLHNKPNSRSASVSRPAVQTESVASPPPMPMHNKPNSRSASVSRPARQEPEIEHNAPPPIPTRSKPTTRNASPVRPPVEQTMRLPVEPAILSPAQSLQSPTYQYESALQSPIEHTATSPVQTQPASSTMSQKARSNSRSMALRPPPTSEAPKHPAIQSVRPASNISENTGSADANHSGSISPVSDDAHSPDSSAEDLQRTATNSTTNLNGAYQARSNMPISSRSIVQPAPAAARPGDRPDRQYQRAPASAEHARFASDARAVIVEPQILTEPQDDADTTTNTSVGHAVTAPGNVAVSQRPREKPAQSQAPNFSQPRPQASPAPSKPPAQASAYPTIAPRAGIPHSAATASRAPQPSYQQTLFEHEQRQARTGTAGSATKRGSSRESKYRRAAWAELGGAGLNEATGMPVPPRQIRQAPVARDSRAAPRYVGADDDLSDLTNSEDEGVEGGLGSYGVRRGMLG